LAYVLIAAPPTSSQTTPPPATPAGSGLDARPDNTTCIATAQPRASAALESQRVFPSLTFDDPLLMLQAPGDDSRWYVVEKRGFVKVVTQDASGADVASTVIDLTDEVNSQTLEAGLLGMAFDPQWASNRRVYLSYTAHSRLPGSVLESRLSRFTLRENGTLSPSSEVVLLAIPQPHRIHNGGNIAFGPDGMLYIGLGDGGPGGDPENRAQNLGNLFGKVLRIDVRGNDEYAVPTDNPFVSATSTRCPAGMAPTPGAICGEIYAYGFRNPWRWSFDRAATAPQMWLGDVGQGAWEEINRIEPGGNYGWKVREGAHCFEPAANCPTAVGEVPLIDPVAEYPHNVGNAVTGGYVYRGTAIASLVGRYVFGDFGTGRVFVLTPDASGALQIEDLLSSGGQISSFGQGNDGELYYVDFSGELFKLVPASGVQASPIPTLLSQTGCVDPANPREPAAGLIPYTPIAPFWSDNAEKQRWMALPNDTTIAVQENGDWNLPSGSVLMKHFMLNGKLIETRLFMRHSDTGHWGGYTYRWDESLTDATLVQGGLVEKVGSQDWTYPSEAQCLQCHTTGAGGTLGLETQQLNSAITYPATGRTANQVATLQAIGVLPAAVPEIPPMPNPFDVAQPLDARARAYLHTNCAQCHRSGGGTPSSMELLFYVPIGATETCNVSPSSGDLGVAGARIVVPGDPSRSVLYLRMSRRDASAMPPVATHLVDEAGAALIRDWISQMDARCQ
jgi:uncharacterized repeat protein (TIGR03806 family)